MNKNKFALMAALIALAIVITGCVGGADPSAAAAPTVAAPAATNTPVSPTLAPTLVPAGPCYVNYTTPGGVIMTLTVGQGLTDSQANSEGTLTVTCRGGSDWTPIWDPAPAPTQTPLPSPTASPTAVPPTAEPPTQQSVATQTPWVITATAVPLTATAVPLTATAVPTNAPTLAPTTAPTNAPTVTPPTGGPATNTCGSIDPMKFEYFQCFTTGFTDIALHGALIDRLDTLYLGVKREMSGGTITTSASDVVALWTGDYINEDVLQGGKLTPYLADHDTGLFLVKPETSVTIPSGFAYVELTGWNGETAPRNGTPALAKGNVEATSCVANASVVPAIQSMLGQEPLFTELDKVANGNPDARLRNGWYTAVQTHAGRTIIWIKTSMVGLGWAEITHADGISLYVAELNGTMDVMYPFSGMDLCDPFPGYNSLPSVTASAKPLEQNVCVENNTLADIVNNHRKTTDLYLRLALLPSATHPAGTYNTLWNSFIVTMGHAAGTNLMPTDQTDTSDGFRGLYFVTTDGTSVFDGMSAVITPCSAFDLATSFSTWWKP